MTLLLYVCIFFIGAAVGSFLNVMISRSVEGKDWISGRSRCDNCGKTLEWYDMVPILSYVVYRGRSRCCNTPLSMQHPIVELMIGLLFIWWVTMGSFFFQLVTHPLSTVQPLFWLLIGVILMSIFISDLFYGVISSLAVAVGSVAVIAYRSILLSAGAYHMTDFYLSLLAAIGATLFFYALRVLTNRRGMGDGDVALAFLLGLLLGWPKTIVGLWLSFVIGAVVSVLLMFAGKSHRKSTIPFGPFMIIGAWIALVWGNELLRLVGF